MNYDFLIGMVIGYLIVTLFLNIFAREADNFMDKMAKKIRRLMQ
jgi:hypothetical protein